MYHYVYYLTLFFFADVVQKLLIASGTDHILSRVQAEEYGHGMCNMDEIQYK